MNNLEIKADERKSIKIAKALYGINPYFYDESDILWKWNATEDRYEITSEREMRAVWNKSDNTIEKLHSRTQYADFLDALITVGYLARPHKVPLEWVQFGKEVYNLHNNSIARASHKHFFTNPHPHTPVNGEPTTINKILRSWVWVKDDERQTEKNVFLLKQIMAYALYRSYPIHKIFVLVGEGRNGKSQFLKLLRNVVGKDNIATADLDLMASNNFHSSQLYKKNVCLMSETNITTIKNTRMLKQLSGGDDVTVEFKYKAPFTAENYAKLIIATNQLPVTHDHSEGFYRRFIIIDFPHKFKVGKDIIDTIPSIEYNILAYELIGILKHLLASGHFILNPTPEEAKRQYTLASSPIEAFIDQTYTRDSEFIPKTHDGALEVSGVTVSEFTSNYNTFLKSKNRRTMMEQQVKNVLQENGYDIAPYSRAISGLKRKEKNQADDLSIDEVAEVTE